MENTLRLPFIADETLEDKLKTIVDAVSDGEGLREVVFHTALTLTLFPSRITHLLRNICFKPEVVKVGLKAKGTQLSPPHHPGAVCPAHLVAVQVAAPLLSHSMG